MARPRGDSGKPNALAALTSQELGILELIGEGLTNRQIGQQLLLAEHTVKNYTTTLFRKLGLKQRTAAAAMLTRTSMTASPNRARTGR